MKIRARVPPHARDLRLDLFRGVANWLIFLGHIPHSLLAWLTVRNYGFSDGADLFVFISGYTATLVYGRTMMERGFIIGATRLWRRVWQIYVAQLLLFLFYTATIHNLANGLALPGLLHEYNVAGLIGHPVEFLTYTIALTFKPVNLDVLPLYVVLMAVFPFALWLMLYLPDAAMAASFVLYLTARYFHWDFPAYPSGFWYFDPFTWQLLFMFGAWLVLGGGDRLGPIVHTRWSLMLSVAFLVFAFAMTLSEHVPALRVLFPDQLRTVFIPNDKTYLAPYRVLHLVALIVLVVHFISFDWHGLHWPIFVPLIKCGQHSLEVFCVGVYLSFLAHVILVTVSDSLPTQLAVGGGGLAIMCTVAWYRAWSKDADRPVPRVGLVPAELRATMAPPPWRVVSERRQRRTELAARLKRQRLGAPKADHDVGMR